MKVERISFTTTIPIDAYGIKDVMTAEAIVLEGEDKFQAMRDLVAYVEAARNEKYPHLYYSNANSQSFKNVDSSFEEPQVGITVNDILSCKELKVLETYRFIKDTKPELREAYISRYEQLKNKSNQTV
jgi:hypothetical protein